MKTNYVLTLLLTLCTACGENVDSSEVDPSDTTCPTEITGPVDPEGDRPPARAEMMGVYDPSRRQVVFFGGDDALPENCTATAHIVGIRDLWIYDSIAAKFTQVPSSNPPPGRARGMAIYDSQNDNMVIFGGRSRATASGAYTNHNDVWALNLETRTWQELTVESGPVPTARSNPAGGYNAVTGELVVFGGNSSTSGLSFSPHRDVWAFSLENRTWRKIPAQGSAPEARLFHAAAVDSEGKRLFVYGGGDAGAWTGPFLGDLWVMDLENGTWQELHAGGEGAPGHRIWGTITYDALQDRVLLFGGHDDGSVGNNNDTWQFQIATNQWSTITEPEVIQTSPNGFCDFPPDFTEPNLEAPERRSAHMAGLDTARMEWIVFGGKTDCGLIDDVWTFDLRRDAWLGLVTPSVGESCVRGDQPDLCVALCQ